MTMTLDAQQAAADAAVAAMVANNPSILTAPDGVSILETEHEPRSRTNVPDQPASPAPTHIRRDRLPLAMARRRAFLDAIAAVRTRGTADESHIATALADANKDGIVTALVSHAVGQLLDRECQRPGTFLHQISYDLGQAIVDAVWANPAGALAMPDDGTAEARYVRSLAEQALTVNPFMYDHRGQPQLAAKPVLPQMSALVPR